jgi:EAL domain-containing protein (putative c-di-GMP-specific phosphodiesterase class I)
MGCRIAIDDFGTGYSNFEYLMRLEPDFIKIDGSITKGILEDKNSQIITSIIVEFAKKIDIKVIAEYVENKEIFEKIKELGVDKSQGYYFSEPKGYL